MYKKKKVRYDCQGDNAPQETKNNTIINSIGHRTAFNVFYLIYTITSVVIIIHFIKSIPIVLSFSFYQSK